MDKLLEVSETAFFYKAISELFSPLVVKYPFLKIFIKGGSLWFLFLNYLNDRKLHSIPIFKNILKYLSLTGKKNVLKLTLEEQIWGFENTKILIADGSILHLLKIIQCKNIEGQNLEVINTAFLNDRFKEFFEKESPVFTYCNNIPLGNGLSVSTYIETYEEVKDKTCIQLKRYIAKVESDKPNLMDVKRDWNNCFNALLDSHYNDIKNRAHVYIGKTTNGYDNTSSMIFKDIILPHGWNLLDFHDKDILKDILDYCNDFIAKYKNYIVNKDIEDYPHVNFTFNMCIIGPSGSGKSQLCRSIVKYLEIQLKINIPCIFIGMDAITNMKEAMNVLVTKEINGKEYGSQAITIFDNMDDANSVLHNTLEKEERFLSDSDSDKSKKDVIITNSKSGLPKIIKTLMSSPLTPIKNMTLFNCLPEMIEGIGPENLRRLGKMIRTTPHDFQKN